MTLRSDGQSLGSLTATTNGDLIGTITIPTAAQSGGQTIMISGENQLNQPISITAIIYLIDSPEDYDGDGVANRSDSCLTVANSGVDADQDGTDDACDGEISDPPNSPASSGTTGGSTANVGPTAPPTASSSANSSAATPALEVEVVRPIAVIFSSNPGNQTGTLDSTALITQNTGDASMLSVGSFAINSKTMALSTRPTGQAGRLPVGTNSIKGVLGAQTINPDRLRPTTKLQTAGNQSASQIRRFGSIRVINWLPWARLFVISLFLLLLVSTLLGRQLKRMTLAG